MYEGLRDGLRAACGVLIVSWIREETDDAILAVERKGVELWRISVARIVLMEAGQQAIDETKHKAWAKANEIVDQILGDVDWDDFFPIQTTFTSFKTIKDIPTGDFRSN